MPYLVDVPGKPACFVLKVNREVDLMKKGGGPGKNGGRENWSGYNM